MALLTAGRLGHRRGRGAGGQTLPIPCEPNPLQPPGRRRQTAKGSRRSTSTASTWPSTCDATRCSTNSKTLSPMTDWEELPTPSSATYSTQRHGAGRGDANTRKNGWHPTASPTANGARTWPPDNRKTTRQPSAAPAGSPAAQNPTWPAPRPARGNANGTRRLRTFGPPPTWWTKPRARLGTGLRVETLDPDNLCVAKRTRQNGRPREKRTARQTAI
eukprot:8746821-Lingulodinium_polyedra.AAC.1